MKKYTRRDFLRAASIASIALSAKPMFKIGDLFAEAPLPNLAVVEGLSPFAITEKAIALLGGMNKFVSKGDVVVIKPNIGWDRKPEQAACTNPEVVGALVKMALNAGAKKVRVLDNTCNDSRRCYVTSGIEEAAKKYGAEVSHVEDFRLREMTIGGTAIKKWEVYKDFVECDKIINVPILKNHGLSGITMGFKNWLGAVGGHRGALHQNIHETVVDLGKFFKPRLTVLDAYRILLRNGPQGGSLDDVMLKKTVVAGIDPVAVDSYGALLFGKKPGDCQFIKNAFDQGLGQMNLEKLNIKKVSV